MFFFFKQKTAYEMRISDWSSDVCSSDLDMGVVGKDDGPVHRKLVFHAKACSAGDPADPLGCCKAPQLRGIFAGGNDRDHVLASAPHRGSDEAADSPPLLPQNRLSAILTPSAVSSSARHCRARQAEFSRFWQPVLERKRVG